MKEDIDREMDHKRIGNGQYRNGIDQIENGHRHERNGNDVGYTNGYHRRLNGNVSGEDSPPVNNNISSYPSTPPPPFPPTTSKSEICSETFLSETIDKIAVSVSTLMLKFGPLSLIINFGKRNN